MKVDIAILPKLSMSELMQLGVDCENNGLSLWVPDERFFRDVFVCLSALAGVTRTCTLGTGVTDPYIRHPLLTASAMASLDELSGGRAVMGIGAGVSGFDALGIKRTGPAKAVREAIDLCRRFWAGEKITHASDHVVANGAQLNFPARAIPIYITGRGPMILALGGEVGDGVIIGHFSSDEGISFALDQIAVGLKKRAPERAKPEIVVWAYTSVCQDGDAARAAVKPAIGRTISSTPEALDLLGEPAPRLLEELARFGYSRSAEYDAAMCEHVSDKLTTHLSVSGTPSECITRIRAIAACGVSRIILLPYPAKGMSITQMTHLLFSDVLPHLNKSTLAPAGA